MENQYQNQGQRKLTLKERILGRDNEMYDDDARKYDNDGYAEEPRVAVEPTRPTGSVSSPTSSSLQMKIVRPAKYADVYAIADHLLNGRTVFVNLEGANKDIEVRLMDFLAGAAHAVEGHIERASERGYIISPKNVDVSGEETARASARKEFF